MATQFASRLSLIAFGVAVMRGLLSGADFQGSLQSALLAAAVFYGFGLVCGDLARRLVEEAATAEFERATTGQKPAK